jgi:hypothetical protein
MPLQRLVHLGQRLISGVRLRQEWDVQGLEAVLGEHLGCMTRSEENPHLRPAIPDLGRKLDPIHLRHHDIDHDKPHPAPADVERTQRLLTIFGLKDAVAGLAEDPVRHSAGKPLVVHHKDSSEGRWSRERQMDSSLEGL